MKAINIHEQMQSAGGCKEDGERVQVLCHEGAGDGQVFIDIRRGCGHQNAGVEQQEFYGVLLPVNKGKDDQQEKPHRLAVKHILHKHRQKHVVEEFGRI